MPVTRRTIKGEKYWVIDRRFRSPDGREERYRRVAQVQTKPAAEAEERRIIEYWTEHGTIKPLLTTIEPKVEVIKQHTWSEAATYWREHIKPSKKRSTGEGYERLLDGPGFKFWKSELPLTEITHAEIVKWGATLAKAGLSQSSRRNHHICLRAVLGAVGPHGGEPGVMLITLPHYPPLPKVGAFTTCGISSRRNCSGAGHRRRSCNSCSATRISRPRSAMRTWWRVIEKRLSRFSIVSEC